MSYEQFAYAYDRLMRDMPYPQWIQWIRDTKKRYDVEVRQVVDLGCGTGTISLALAEEGYEVTGIDISEDMLAVAEQKQQTMRTQTTAWPVTWIHQDMREWQLMDQVDMVVSLCDCLNYILEESEVQLVFEHTYASLRSGGIFLFDVHTLEEMYAYADNQPYHLNEDDVAYIWTNELNPERMEIEHDLTIFVKDHAHEEQFHRIQEQHVQRGYDLVWLEQMLRDAGFVDITVGADFTWDEPGQHAQRAFFACRKPQHN
jgi:SAM-dependent methyltransferase